MKHRARFLALQALLTEHQALWRPQPFHVRRPEWCAHWPALAEAALALDEPQREQLAADPEASQAWLAPHLPVTAELERLCTVPEFVARTLPPCDVHFDRGIPGRKRAQIHAFAAQGGLSRAPLLEWCAGKGHLGRRLALDHGVPVRSLEINPLLCAEAAQLAARANIAQTVLCADALDEASHAHVHGHAVLALHACGELHRTLVRGAARDGAESYRIAPCCYHLGAPDGYRPLSRDAHLALDSGALRLAVTETVTAPRHIRLRLARDQAWKLGFVALRASIEGEAIRPFRSVPPQWLSQDFACYGRALAQRERLTLPAQVDWAHWLAVGETRRAEVLRFELVRHAFRRALEMWLVMDLAQGFEEAGFDVQVGSFCARSVTPRNLMVQALRPPVAPHPC